MTAAERLARLSPEKRMLLTRVLQERGGEAIPTRKNGSTAPPLSSAQRRLWFLDQLQDSGAVYNICSGVRFHGALDLTAFENAVNGVIRRHESLRTCFGTLDQEPVQIIAPELKIRVRHVSLDHSPDAESEAHQIAQTEAKELFDLARGPLLRVTVLRFSDQDHVAIFTIHHIISDGWSMAVLTREVLSLYQAVRHGVPSSLPPLRLQYADYAEWEREFQANPQSDEQLAYWQRRLEGAPPALELRTDYPRPAEPSWSGASAPVAIPGHTVEALSALARSEDCTPFMALLAVFQLLLHRYSHQKTILVGTPVANRSRTELENLIGFFVNTLVLRADFTPDLDFRTFLRQVRTSTLGAYAHQEIPFERVVNALRPERQLSTAPLFQAMFTLQSASSTPNLRNLPITPFPIKAEAAPFDLLLNLGERDGRIEGELVYATELFTPATAHRIVEHFVILLDALVADPAQLLSRAPILSAEERVQILEEWNATTVASDDELLAYELVERQAELRPDALAVVFEDRRLTYQELNSRANRMAHSLIARGIGPGSFVSLELDRSPEMIVAMLGVLKTGAAYVPVDPAYPAERRRYIREDSQAALLIDAELLDRESEAIASQTDSNPGRPVMEDDLAYVIYTSGSTGKPKGVMTTHRGLVNHAERQRAAYGIGEGSRVLQFASYTFDASVWEIYQPLVSGGTLYLARRESLMDPVQLVELLEQLRITAVMLPPSVLKVMPDAELPELRTLIAAGEACPGSVVRRWARGRRFMNGYGPTEITVISTAAVCAEDLAGDPPIGRAMANARMYVLDADLQLVPVGVAGELYIGGPGLARGYLARPGLTAERFVPDPYGKEPGARLYRSGDVVRWRENGEIEYLGRADRQVKVRGFRIEVGEIESVLLSCPDLTDAVVQPREDRLVAYVVPRSEVVDRVDLVDALGAMLKARLPEYMIPSAFVTLDALPLNPNGKIDVAALPVPDRANLRRPELVAPRNPGEEMIASMWREQLRLDHISIEDNFFELGGDSIKAALFANALQTRLQRPVPVRQVFQYPTVAELAAVVFEVESTEERVALTAIPKAPRDRVLPLSFAQQRMWFLNQLEPDSTVYHIPEVVRLSGALDLAVLTQALNKLMERHDILRTSIDTKDGLPHQIVASHLPFSLEAEDVRHLAEAEIKDLRREEAMRPFDLAQGPVVRMRLLRVADDEHLLLLTIHHIAADGWSIGILLREFVQIYSALIGGKQAELAAFAIQYLDYAAWQRQHLAGEFLESELAWWRNKLAGATSLDLPTDRQRPAVLRTHGAAHGFRLPAAIAKNLDEFSRREGVTMFMSLAAALNVLLMRYSGQTDICIGTPVAGRSRSEVQGLVGLFVNTLVLRTDLSGDASFRELCSRVSGAAQEAYSHQDVPFEKLVDEIQPKRDLSLTPLFQVMLLWQNLPMAAADIPGLAVAQMPAETQASAFDLTFAIAQDGEGLSVEIVYNTDLFDPSTIQRMAAHYGRVLEQAMEEPSRLISRMEMLSAAEQQALARTDEPVPVRADCFHLLFETQARRNPDAIAVECGSARLSYAELNARANQVAHWLRRQGIGPDSLVAISLGRTPELLIALLGVIKAGGAYVPVDPNYPPERTAFMLEDSGATLRLANLDHEALARESAENPIPLSGPSHLAYVIYTSGSTGRPKGAGVTHGGLSNLLDGMQGNLNVTERDVVLCVTSVSFDIATMELFLPLIAGAKVVLGSSDMARDPEMLAAEIGRCSASLVQATPVTWQMLVNSGWTGHPGLTILSGGEALKRSLANALCDGGATVWNGYGPTETAIYSVACPVSSGDGPVMIGKPVQNTETFVLDSALELVPVGVRGELYIGGAGVARGYLNRPELTAERFVPDPFGPPGSRMYRTGDVVRWREDGNLEYIGRSDGQVKIRGFRVEPGEIETVLRGHTCVREAVVVAQGARLAAYLVPAEEQRPSFGEVRGWLMERLPEYMVPAVWMWLEKVPLTANGKVDRRSLPPIQEEDRQGERSGREPETPAEIELAAIWRAVLGVKKVLVEDNFFELGGDSILSIQVVSRARQRGLQITPRQIFQYPRLVELAAASGNPGEKILAEQGMVEGAAALTPIQRWFFEQELAEPQHFNQSVLLEVKGELKRETLERALEQLVLHHDALRLRFEHTAEGWAQIYSAEARVELAGDIAGLQEGMELTAGPLLRAAYSEESKRLLIAIHHLVMDGVSWRILLEDLASLLGGGNELPAKTSSYRQWAQALEEYGRSEQVRNELQYWQEAAASAVRLPRDFEAGENTEATLERVAVTLDAERTADLLQRVPSVYHTEIDDVLLSALWKTLSEWSGSRVVTIAREGHGREEISARIDVSRTVGWFTALYPVKLEASPRDWPGGVLKQVKEQVRGVPRHGIGYGVLRYLGDRPLGEVQEPEVSFNYLGQLDRGLAEVVGRFGLSAADRGTERSPRNQRPCLVDITGAVSGGRLSLEWSYSREVHRRETMERLAANYLRAIEETIAHCLMPAAGGFTPSDFPLAKLDQKKLDRLLSKSGRGTRPGGRT